MADQKELRFALEEIGFNDTESKIYLYLLKKGRSSQQNVSDDLSIVRQTVYDIMGKMLAKGQISQSVVGKRKAYLAIEPKILLRKLKEKEDSFQKILPDLENLKSLNTPNVFSETFIGLEGLKNLFNMTLESKTDVLWTADEKSHNKLFKDYYWENYAQKRIEQKIPIKLLASTKIKSPSIIWKTDKKVWREVRMHDFVNNTKASYVVFDDKVIIYSLENYPYGVMIQNKILNQMFEKIFFSFWDDVNEI